MIYIVLFINSKTKQCASIQINSDISYEEMKLKTQSRYITNVAKQCNIDLTIFDQLRLLCVPEKTIQEATKINESLYGVLIECEQQPEVIYFVTTHPSLLSDRNELHIMLREILEPRGLLEKAEDCYSFGVDYD